jgi:two-component system LytT family sensor kinase
MKKGALHFVLLLLFPSIIAAQPLHKSIKKLIDSVRAGMYVQKTGSSFMFHGKVYDNRRKSWGNYNSLYSASDTAVYRLFEWLRFDAQHGLDSIRQGKPGAKTFFRMPGSSILLGVRVNPGLTHFLSSGIQSVSKHYAGYLIPDSSEVAMIAMGINKANVNNYRYHVVADDSIEVIPWTIPKLEQHYGAKQPYGLIGRFTASGKQLVVEVVNIKNYSERDGVVLDWRLSHQPIVTRLEAAAYNDHFVIAKGHSRGYVKRFEETTGLPADLKFAQGSITRLSFEFKNHETLHYQIWLQTDSANSKKDIRVVNNITNNYDFSVNNYCKPGKYRLVIKPTSIEDESQWLIFPFEVTPPIADKRFTGKQLVPYIFILAILLIGWYLYYRQKLKKANRDKAAANLKLSGVRAQLNPHFMFNALTSIQNLMNQNDLDGANNYLNKFAVLTRQVLNSSGQELISLEDELQIITNYLQMEQLRFGFVYTIDVDTDINCANTEIPAMLLQPFIENAAKHGVGGLQKNGKIAISIHKERDNLILTVADNGAGFSEKPNTGFGLKLSEERIELLNQIYKSQFITLKIDSSNTGSKITIALTNWL